MGLSDRDNAEKEVERLVFPDLEIVANTIFPYELLTTEEKQLYDRAYSDVASAQELLCNLVFNEDWMTLAHSSGVARIVTKILCAEGVDDERVAVSKIQAALYHDVGKIVIPKGVLYKPDVLTDADFELIKRHSIEGYYRVLPYFRPEYSASVLLHHWFQGNPYPMFTEVETCLPYPQNAGVIDSATDIAAIIAIADHAEAQHPNSPRPYRRMHRYPVGDLHHHIRRSIGDAYTNFELDDLLDQRLLTIQEYASSAPRVKDN